MPVYLATVHAYGSWQEDHPKGYVQHGEGLKSPSRGLAKWRDAHALQDRARFEHGDRLTLREVASTLATNVKLHGIAITPTHVHQLVSFVEPLCGCRKIDYCGKACEAYRFTTDYLTRFKRSGGATLSKQNAMPGRKWFSRGWDITPVRTRDHFDHLMMRYLPKHVREAGIVVING